MSTMDDAIRLIQETETGKGEVTARAQALDAATEAANAAAQAVRVASEERDRAVAAQAARVEQLLTLIRGLYGDGSVVG